MTSRTGEEVKARPWLRGNSRLVFRFCKQVSAAGPETHRGWLARPGR